MTTIKTIIIIIIIIMYKMHHPKADIDRLYVKRKEGGGGLMQVEAACKAEIINIAQYLNTNYRNDQLVNIVKNHENTTSDEFSNKISCKDYGRIRSTTRTEKGNTRGQAKHEGKISGGFEEEMEK